MDTLPPGAPSEKHAGGASRTLQVGTVRNEAELKIADYFAKNRIRYTSGSLFPRSAVAKPRFYLEDYGVYVEYWELTGGSREYEKEMKWKMAHYHKNNIRLISIYPRNLDRLDSVFPIKFRQVVGLDLPGTGDEALRQQ